MVATRMSIFENSSNVHSGKAGIKAEADALAASCSVDCVYRHRCVVYPPASVRRRLQFFKEQGGLVQTMPGRQQFLLDKADQGNALGMFRMFRSFFVEKGRNGSRAMVSAAHSCKEMCKMVLRVPDLF